MYKTLEVTNKGLKGLNINNPFREFRCQVRNRISANPPPAPCLSRLTRIGICTTTYTATLAYILRNRSYPKSREECKLPSFRIAIIRLTASVFIANSIDHLSPVAPVNFIVRLVAK